MEKFFIVLWIDERAIVALLLLDCYHIEIIFVVFSKVLKIKDD